MEREENTAPEHELQFEGHDFVFIDEPSSEQFCSVCLLVMKNAVQTVCGHRFCRHCLVGTFREGHHACPEDRNPIPEEGGFFPDVAWERNILSLRVKCKMSKRGCDWTGQLRHFQSHSDKCQYEDVTCDDCDEEMQRRFLDTHLTSECGERVVQCVYCKDEFAFWRLELHQREDCTRLPLACPQQCGVQDIPREEVESHVKDDCSMTVVVCPYEEAGCTFHDKRANLKAHIEKSSEDHLRKTWSAFLKAKHELNEVKDNVDEIQVSVKTLQSEKEAMQMSLQRCNEEFGELKLSERKLEVENMSLKKEMTELGRKLENVKDSAAAENRSLKEVVQDMQRKLETLEREGKNMSIPPMPGDHSSYKTESSAQETKKEQSMYQYKESPPESEEENQSMYQYKDSPPESEEEKQSMYQYNYIPTESKEEKQSMYQYNYIPTEDKEEKQSMYCYQKESPEPVAQETKEEESMYCYQKESPEPVAQETKEEEPIPVYYSDKELSSQAVAQETEKKQPTAYYPPYRYEDKNEVPTKQEDVVRETTQKEPTAYQYLPYWYDDKKEVPTKQEDVVQETRQKEPTAYYPPYWYEDKKEVPTKQEDVVQETRQKEPTAYYPLYRYADKKEVPAKQKADVQETRKKKESRGRGCPKQGY